MTSFDAIVVGGGHNGLVVAALLARAGRRTLVLEAADGLGGPGRTEAFFPGYRASTAHLLNRLHPEVIRALGLDPGPSGPAGGDPAPTTILADGRPPLILHGAYGETVDGDLAAADRAGWATLRAQLLRHAGLLKPFLARHPPDLRGLALDDRLALGGAALSLKRLGREEMRDVLRMLLTNVADVADEHLGDDRLKGLLAFDATLGSHLGPRSPTSLLGLYHRLSGAVGGRAGAQLVPQGGMGGVIDAIAAAARAAGAEIRTGAVVRRIRVEAGRVAGVELADGDVIAAPTVVSAISPAATLLELVGPRALDTGVVRKARAIRARGDVASLHLALAGAPDFAGVPAAALAGRLVVVSSTDHVETAFNPAKYGDFSPHPVIEITLPSVADPSLAPAGGCVVSALVQYAPYALRGGWEAGRPRLLAAVMAVLERHAPGIGRQVRHAELLTPVDIEARYRMPGGHWHHGELQADAMLMNRPFFGAEAYAAPVDGLWLASAGAHPGGGISGLPGLNAARAALKGRGVR